MRGKVYKDGKKVAAGGITPAYAGKRISHPCPRLSGRDHPRLCGEKGFAFLKFRPPTRDHPRLCGEKTIQGLFLQALRGSPPPMRGKVFKLHMSFLPIRITPAYAGKSLRVAPNSITNRDHPRLCGEKVQAFCVAP